MSKKLPRIFKNDINKEINNNRSVYYVHGDSDDFSFTSKEEKVEDNNISISEKLNNIFKSGHHSFNIGVIITTKDKTYDTKIAGKIKDYIITLDNDVILEKDILDIKIK